jgi:hypothetical protein
MDCQMPGRKLDRDIFIKAKNKFIPENINGLKSRGSRPKEKNHGIIKIRIAGKAPLGGWR